MRKLKTNTKEGDYERRIFAGLALGAIMGAIMLEISPDAKQLVEKGQNMIEKKFKQKK